MINLNEMKRDYIGREPRDYIVESVTVPEGLEEKVMAAMTQKRKEIEEIQHEKLSLRQEKQEKKAAHKSVALRAAVIAAVITLMILIIPSSRQVVVSAAESAWNSIIEWWNGWINPFYTQGVYGGYDEFIGAKSENVTLHTQEIKSDVIDISDFNYQMKWNEWNEISKDLQLNVQSENNNIFIHKMFFSKIDNMGTDYDDLFFSCKFLNIPRNRNDYELSQSSVIEFIFLKNNKPCIKINCRCECKNFYENDGDTAEDCLRCPWVLWYDPKYENIVAPDDVERIESLYLKDILSIIKPEKIEVASVTLIHVTKQDYFETDDFNIVTQMIEKGYDYEDWSSEYENEDGSITHESNYEVYKTSVTVVKGYNSKYYDLNKEKKNNKKLLDEYLSLNKSE